MKTLLALALTSLAVAFVSADSETSDPNALDFWIGEWQVTWKDADGKSFAGSNTVTRILDGKVIQEEFDASEALGFTGRSVSVLDTLTGKWKQTWVDSNGSYMDFEGHQDGETFIFQRAFTNAKGEAVENRMVFRDITPNALTWDWEGRRDPNSEWKLLWQLQYTRKNPAPASPQNADSN